MTPERKKEIDKVLAVIRSTWYLYPQLRLGQLIVNAIPVGQDPFQDPFYVTDPSLVAFLEKYPDPSPNL
jgi:hypothetical protein